MLSIIDHISFGTSALIGSMMGVCRALNVFGFLHATHREMAFLASNYTPRWSIFIISLVVGLFHGISPFSPKSSDGPELGHFRDDVEEIRLPVPVRPRFFPIPFILSHFARGKK